MSKNLSYIWNLKWGEFIACVLRKISNEALIILFRAFNPKIQTDKYTNHVFCRIRI